ncbi:hypothetical protein WJX73_002608 [Symbiochloris irregularis]|uniref:Uncharacterized protein n=1 Tax=Symbiochloris irregularis TaxID=706552 RepID=A0AAW1P9C1_9CHLO
MKRSHATAFSDQDGVRPTLQTDRRRSATSSPAVNQLQYFATCHPGLEPALAAEIENSKIGAHSVEMGTSGVSFRAAQWRTGLLANVWLRSASFSVEARVAGRGDVNENFLRLRARDAICDAIRDRRGSKPAPPERGQTADLPLFIYLSGDQITLYRDMSGASLHKRGYRGRVIHKAALNEAAAAGILIMSGWPELVASGADVTLADPMCGSGTLLIEAALMAAHVAPGLRGKRWAFQSWPDSDPLLLKDCLEEAEQIRRQASWKGHRLMGCDVHSGALSLAKEGLQAAGVDHMVSLHHVSCHEWQPQKQPNLVVVNPPHGNRLLPMGRASRTRGPQQHPRQHPAARPWDSNRSAAVDAQGDASDASELEVAWRHLSTFLKGQCPDADAFVLSGNAVATRFLHMQAAKTLSLSIGGADCRLLHYHVLPPKAAAAADSRGPW